MTKRLRWTEHAILQLESLAEYVSLASPIYAEQLVDRIVSRLKQAITYPESGRVVPEYAEPNVRELIEGPYRIIYHMSGDAIEILSIMHGRRALSSPGRDERVE